MLLWDLQWTRGDMKGRHQLYIWKTCGARVTGALGWSHDGGHGFPIPRVLLKQIDHRPSFVLDCSEVLLSKGKGLFL